MSLHFLLDEHVDRAVQRQLRRSEPQMEVLAVGDVNAPPAGTTDPHLLRWLEVHGHVLVTQDRATMPLHLAAHLEEGRHIAGVIWIRPRIGLGQIIEELRLIWTVATEDDFQDRLLFIPL